MTDPTHAGRSTDGYSAPQTRPSGIAHCLRLGAPPCPVFPPSRCAFACPASCTSGAYPCAPLRSQQPLHCLTAAAPEARLLPRAAIPHATPGHAARRRTTRARAASLICQGTPRPRAPFSRSQLRTIAHLSSRRRSRSVPRTPAAGRRAGHMARAPPPATHAHPHAVLRRSHDAAPPRVAARGRTAARASPPLFHARARAPRGPGTHPNADMPPRTRLPCCPCAPVPPESHSKTSSCASAGRSRASRHGCLGRTSSRRAPRDRGRLGVSLRAQAHAAALVGGAPDHYQVLVADARRVACVACIRHASRRVCGQHL